MSNGKAIKGYNYSLNSWIDKKAQCKWMNIFLNQDSQEEA